MERLRSIENNLLPLVVRAAVLALVVPGVGVALDLPVGPLIGHRAATVLVPTVPGVVIRSR